MKRYKVTKKVNGSIVDSWIVKAKNALEAINIIAIYTQSNYQWIAEQVKG